MIDEKKLMDELKQSGMIVDNEYGNAIVDMVGSQPKIGGWIPCSERLPEENQDVIACFAHGTVTELRFYDEEFHGVYDYDGKVIIAWQPLPEPYRPERKSENEK